MSCKSFTAHDDPLMDDFVQLPRRLYANDSWYVPVTNSRLVHQFNPDQNPFFSYGYSRQFILYRDGLPITRCAAARNPRMDQADSRIGTIGYFESENDTEAAAVTIAQAIEWLKEQGVNLVYGPMNFSIWRNYRFRMIDSEADPYLGDIYNKTFYADLFRAAGFRSAGIWRSAEIDVETQLSAIEQKQDKFARRLKTSKEAGYEITPHRGSAKTVFDELQDLVMESYSGFLGFYPLSREEFRQIFSPLEHTVRPEQLLLARKAGKLSGFLIQHWDWSPLLRGRKHDPGLITLLRMRYGPVPRKWVMSIAGVRKEATEDRAGLGSALLHEGMRQALRKGARRIVYSLMSEHNRSNSFWNGIPAKLTNYQLFQIEI